MRRWKGIGGKPAGLGNAIAEVPGSLPQLPTLIVTQQIGARIASKTPDGGELGGRGRVLSKENHAKGRRQPWK